MGCGSLPWYNPELAKVNWETVKGYDRDSGDSEDEAASAHAAEVPAVEPPSRGRGRWPVTPRGGSATKSLRDVLDASSRWDASPRRPK